MSSVQNKLKQIGLTYHSSPIEKIHNWFVLNKRFVPAPVFLQYRANSWTCAHDMYIVHFIHSFKRFLWSLFYLFVFIRITNETLLSILLNVDVTPKRCYRVTQQVDLLSFCILDTAEPVVPWEFDRIICEVYLTMKKCIVFANFFLQ